MTISSFISGQAQNPNIVLIHGVLASHLDMTPIANMLSDRYRVINIDLPGTGLSTWDNSIQTIDDFADALLPILPQKAIYLGWSFGGLVCQSLAARYPERVQSLIGVTTSPKFIGEESTHWLGLPPPGFLPLIGSFLNEGKSFQDIIQMFYENEFSHIHPKPKTYQELQNIFTSQDPTHPLNHQALQKRLAICDHADLRAALKNIQCPIDFIMGEKDMTPDKNSWDQIKKLNSKIKIHEIKDAQHIPFWTKPEAFKAALDRILG